MFSLLELAKNNDGSVKYVMFVLVWKLYQIRYVV
jgi:hypothetical protein